MTSPDQVPCGVTEMDQTCFTLIKVDMSITLVSKGSENSGDTERHRWLDNAVREVCDKERSSLKRVISTARVWYV